MSKSRSIKICTTANCDRNVIAREMCSRHYEKWRSNTVGPLRLPRSKVCKIEGCDLGNHTRGMCRKHYYKWQSSQVQDPLPGDIKTCRKCGETKPAGEFNKHGGGRRSTCKACQAKYLLGYRRKKPPSVVVRRRCRLKKKYGISIECYNEMFAAQEGKCAICSIHAVRLTGSGSLCVDHDHGSGIVRSLLCVSCNAGLGNFKENISVFECAIAYLRAHK